MAALQIQKMNGRLNSSYMWKGRSWVLEQDGLAGQTVQLTEGPRVPSNSADHPLMSAPELFTLLANPIINHPQYGHRWAV